MLHFVNDVSYLRYLTLSKMEATLNEFYEDIDLQCSAGGSNNVAGGTKDGDVNANSILTDNKTGETEKNEKIPDKKYFTKDGKIDTVTLCTKVIFCFQ